MASHYDVLGVSKNATDKEIRQAYRRLARKHHPDLNAGDKDAEAKFKRINEAYEVLSDSETRTKYNRYGDRWKQADQLQSQSRGGRGSPFEWTYRHEGRGGGFGADLFGGFDDLLGQFGGRSAPRRIEAPLAVTLEEALSGTKRPVTVPSREGARDIEVTIPPGVDTGSVIHVSLDKGNDLFINVTVSPHARFKREGSDLYVEVQVPFVDAVLGSDTEIRTLKGRVRLKVPPESQNGQKIRLAGQGMPKVSGNKSRGDLFVILRPTLPKNLKDEERELFEKFRALQS